MKVTLNRKEKIVVGWIVGVVLILLIVSNILLWRVGIKSQRNVQSLLNYVTIQIQRGVFPSAVTPKPKPQPATTESSEQPKEEVKKDGK